MRTILNVNANQKSLSDNDFASFGTPVLAYIKPVIVNDKKAFALNAADGKIISLTANEQLALTTAHEKNLMPLLVH